MAKILCLCFLLYLVVFPFKISAAVKQDVIDAAKATNPNKYDFLYLIQLENIFSQIELAEKKYDRLIEIIQKSKTMMDQTGKIELAEESNNEYILEMFDEICSICGLSYEYSLAGKDPSLTFDNVVCHVYDSEGNLIGTINGNKNTVKKTGQTIHDTDNFTTIIILVPVILIGTVFAYRILTNNIHDNRGRNEKL